MAVGINSTSTPFQIRTTLSGFKRSKSCSLGSQKISKVLQHFSRDTAYLAGHFNRASSSRLFELQKPMVDYFREIKNICDQLSSIGNTVSEHMKIHAALLGLGRDYEPIKTSIEGSMDVHKCFQNRGRNRENNFFSTRGRGFPKYISSAPSSRSSDYEDSESRHVYQICGKPCHVAMGCWHKFDNSYQMDEMHSAFAALRISDFSDVAGHEWFPDTGASAHITNSPLHLQKRSSLSWVRLCHGRQWRVLADQSYRTNKHWLFFWYASCERFLVYPSITKPLFSVSKFTKDYPCGFNLHKPRVSINDKCRRYQIIYEIANDL